MAAAKTAAKKKTIALPLFKRWETDDEKLVFRLDIEKPGHEIELTVEDMDAKKQTIIELAVDVPQIDEIMALLAKVKDALQRYNRGETIESDIEEEEEEEEGGITISGLDDEDDDDDDDENEDADEIGGDEDEDEDEDLEDDEDDENEDE